MNNSVTQSFRFRPLFKKGLSLENSEASGYSPKLHNSHKLQKRVGSNFVLHFKNLSEIYSNPAVYFRSVCQFKTARCVKIAIILFDRLRVMIYLLGLAIVLVSNHLNFKKHQKLILHCPLVYYFP